MTLIKTKVKRGGKVASMKASKKLRVEGKRENVKLKKGERTGEEPENEGVLWEGTTQQK